MSAHELSIPMIEQTAGRGAARAARRRRARAEQGGRRPGWATYAFLVAAVWYRNITVGDTYAAVLNSAIAVVQGG